MQNVNKTAAAIGLNIIAAFADIETALRILSLLAAIVLAVLQIISIIKKLKSK